MRGEILLDANDQVFVLSCTRSTDFPMSPGAPQAAFAGGTHDGVLVKLNASLTSLVWSTSGSPTISPTAFLVDYCDKIYVSGWGSNLGPNYGPPLTTNGLAHHIGRVPGHHRWARFLSRGFRSRHERPLLRYLFRWQHQP
ncbi:MAG: hypothetical protein IPG69_14830 [Flavobacteriales bacterium]|nr:hypothetical protein [Flavobacteriales bacterium]